MNIIRPYALLFLVLTLFAAAFQAAAHTGVQSTTPPSGATLEQSPPAIEIRFHAAINLTAVVVVDASKAERKLDTARKEKARRDRHARLRDQAEGGESLLKCSKRSPHC